MAGGPAVEWTRPRPYTHYTDITWGYKSENGCIIVDLIGLRCFVARACDLSTGQPTSSTHSTLVHSLVGSYHLVAACLHTLSLDTHRCGVRATGGPVNHLQGWSKHRWVTTHVPFNYILNTVQHHVRVFIGGWRSRSWCWSWLWHWLWSRAGTSGMSDAFLKPLFWFKKLNQCFRLLAFLSLRFAVEWRYCTLDSNTLNSLLPRALQNSLHLSLGETPAYFGIHCFTFPLWSR